MTQPRLALSRFRLKNFKAVRDSGIVRFTPLTVFIGNNGVGKSSLIEGLETLRFIREHGLDAAMGRWREFKYILNQASPHMLVSHGADQYYSNPMVFDIAGAAEEGVGESVGWRRFHASSEITARPTPYETDQVFFLNEKLTQSRPGRPQRIVTRTIRGLVLDETEGSTPFRQPLTPDESVLRAETTLVQWQFVRLNPEAMSQETRLDSVGSYLPLAPDGSNLAQFLLNLIRQRPGTLNGIVETMQTVLPYLVDVQPITTEGIGRSVYLQLAEQKFKVPSWLFSTGTLRLVALLALFRHPDPPPLIVIEELENGLDPRSVNLIVEEIRNVVRQGKSQVIITTHSPYLLDLVPLSSLVFVERIDGQPSFTRPEDDQSVQKWNEDFAPGRLYTMGKFRKNQ